MAEGAHSASVNSKAARYITAVLAPAVALLVPTALLPPETLLFGLWIGLAAVIVLLALAVLYLLVSRKRPLKDPPWTVLLLALCCTVVTGLYWFRAALGPYDDWEGLRAGITLIYLGWVPSFLLASAAWSLEEVLMPAGGWARLLKALAAAASAVLLGIALGAGFLRWYLAHYDRTPLSRDVQNAFLQVKLYGEKAAGPDRAWLRYDLKEGHLRIFMDLALPLDRSVLVRATMEQVMKGAQGLLHRRDTRAVTLTVRVNGRQVLEFSATDADAGRPVWALAAFHGERLPGGGRLTDDELRDLIGTEFLQAAVKGNTVWITFHPPAPWGPDTAEPYGRAWETVNRVMADVARLFPEIERFYLEMAGQELEIVRTEVGKDFFAQRKLTPQDRVLVLQVHEADRPRPPYAPESFSAIVSGVSPFQVGVAVTADAIEFQGRPLYEFKGCRLYEPCFVSPRVMAVLYVGDIGPDGTVTIAVGLRPGEPLLGPLRIGPGERAEAGRLAVYNLGWFDRSRFP